MSEEMEFDILEDRGIIERPASMRDKYRHVFSSGIGREVLADILKECHFGSTLNPDNSANIAEYNVGICILAKMGVFGRNVSEVVNALCGVPPE